MIDELTPTLTLTQGNPMENRSDKALRFNRALQRAMCYLDGNIITVHGQKAFQLIGELISILQSNPSPDIQSVLPHNLTRDDAFNILAYIVPRACAEEIVEVFLS